MVLLGVASEFVRSTLLGLLGVYCLDLACRQTFPACLIHHYYIDCGFAVRLFRLTFATYEMIIVAGLGPASCRYRRGGQSALGANRRSMTGRRNPLRDLLLLGRVPPSVIAMGGTGCAPYSAALGPNRDLAAGGIARNPSSNCRIPGIGYRISLHLAVSRGHRSPGLLPGRDFRIVLTWSPVA